MVGDDSSKALQVSIHIYIFINFIHNIIYLNIQMTYERDSLKDVSQPKHGKVSLLASKTFGSSQLPDINFEYKRLTTSLANNSIV